MFFKCYQLVKELLLTMFSRSLRKCTLVPVHHATNTAVKMEMKLLYTRTFVLDVHVWMFSSLQPPKRGFLEELGLYVTCTSGKGVIKHTWKIRNSVKLLD
jgi:hypothetical protein